MVSYDISHANKGVQNDVNEFVKLSESKGIRFIGASASLNKDVQEFKTESGNTFEYLEETKKF